MTKAEWSKDTKMLGVTYDPAKTNIESIDKRVAASGHDTDKTKADDKAYAKLPVAASTGKRPSPLNPPKWGTFRTYKFRKSSYYIRFQ